MTKPVFSNEADYMRYMDDYHKKDLKACEKYYSPKIREDPKFKQGFGFLL